MLPKEKPTSKSPHTGRQIHKAQERPAHSTYKKRKTDDESVSPTKKMKNVGYEDDDDDEGQEGEEDEMRRRKRSKPENPNVNPRWRHVDRPNDPIADQPNPNQPENIPQKRRWEIPVTGQSPSEATRPWGCKTKYPHTVHQCKSKRVKGIQTKVDDEMMSNERKKAIEIPREIWCRKKINEKNQYER